VQVSQRTSHDAISFARRVFLLVSCSVLIVISQAWSVSGVAAHGRSASKVATNQQTTASACIQPPQSVDFQQLSDAQLQEYGFPPRGILEANPTHWATILSHARHRSCDSKPDPLHRMHRPQMSTQDSIQPDTPTCPQPGSACGLTTWAGNEASEWPVVRGLYRESEIEFAVPTISTANASAHTAIWSGVGGDSLYVTQPAVLVQDGIDMSVDNGQQVNTAWWDVDPGFDGQFITLAGGIHVGDTIDATTTSNYQNDGYDYFSIYNMSTYNYFSCELNTTGGTNFNDCLPAGQKGNTAWNSDSASGECIVERPVVNGNPSPLAQFQLPGQASNTLETV